MALFDDFDALNLAMVEKWIVTEQEEHLSLDFKRLNSADLTSQDDKDNFAIALSGFSNSAGGILVWGVTTKKHKGGKVEVAGGRSEIADLPLAVGRLNEFTGVLVMPRLDGIRHKKIETAASRGFVATLIPESDTGPHMALAGVHNYYKRNGDRFLPMEHFEIADMFGRRRRPVLSLELEPARGSSSSGPGGTFREIVIKILLRNDGRGSAVAPYVRFESSPPYRIRGGEGLASADAAAALRLRIEPPKATTGSVIGDSSIVLHPGVTFELAAVAAEIGDKEPVPQLRINYGMAALDYPLVEDTRLLSADVIAPVLSRSVAPVT